MDAELAQFVRGRYSALQRRAYLLTGNHAAAEDLLQEALVRCCVAWRRGAVDHPDAYIQRVMINLLTSIRRRRIREVPITVLPVVSEDDGASERGERDRLWRALQRLPPGQRAVLVLRYYEDLDERGIADVLGISVGTVRSQVAKGLTKLREVTSATQIGEEYDRRP